MADNLESDPTQEPGQPSSDPSGSEGDSSTSNAGQGQFVPIAKYTELEKTVEALVKGQQSTKDKRIHKLEKNIGEQNEVLMEMAKKLGVSPEDAQKAAREMAIDALIAGESQSAAPAQAAVPAPVDPEPAHAFLMGTLNLEGDDPDVVRIMRDQAGDEMYTALAALSKDRASGVQPNAAQVALTPDKGAPQVSPDNPIADINDPQALYKIEEDKIKAQAGAQR